MGSTYGSFATLVPPNNPLPPFRCDSCGRPTSSGPRSIFTSHAVLDEDGRFKRDRQHRIIRELVPLTVGATCSFCVPQGSYRSRGEARSNRRADRRAFSLRLRQQRGRKAA